MKRILALLICLVAMFSLFSCEVIVSTGGEVEVWSAPSVVKVLRSGVDYSAIKGDASVSVYACRNEYESAQLILTAKSKVNNYSIEVSDLVSGTQTFSKENIEVLVEKYITINKITTSINVPTGDYPDALVPVEKIIAYGENSIKAGDNQGIWFSFYVPENQPAGVYSGTVTVNTDGKSTSVPVSLEVADYTVSSETHSKSVFLTGWGVDAGELDSTDAMLQMYNQALVDFRLAPNALIQDTAHRDEDISYYVDLAVGYLVDGAITNVSIPAVQVTVDGYPCMSQAHTVKYINAFTDASVRDGKNYLSKVLFYNSIIDEPHNRLPDAQVIVNMREFNETIAEAAQYAQNLEGVNEDIKAEIVNSINNMQCIVTAPYYEEVADSVETWCPTVNYYDTEEQRANYANQEEKWWYTCVNPKNPYPSYHIDDNLVSSRVLSWMQYKYDVVGNLYWAVDVYKELYTDPITDNSYYVDIEDKYQTGNRYPTANGDGFLFYPGKYYGVDGPITSIRLHSIRDGLEEYEMLYALERKYEELCTAAGVANGYDKVMAYLHDRLFEGTKCYTDSEEFNRVRKTLVDMLVAAYSDKAVVVNNIEETANGYDVSIFANCAVTVNGEQLTATEQNAVKVYNYTLNKDASKASELAVEAEGYEIGLYLEGTVEGGALGVNNVTSQNGTVSEENGKVKVTFASNNDGRHSFYVNGDFLSEIGANADKFAITLTLDKASSYELRCKFNGKNYFIAIEQGKLQAGANVLEVTNLFGYNWSDYEGVEEIQVVIGDSGEEAVSVTLETYTVVKK